MRTGFILILSLFIAIPSALAASSHSAQRMPGDVSHIHWLGIRKIAMNTNAANFMGVWDLPESIALKALALDNLSTAPWRLLKTENPFTNHANAQLRPLLDDLVQEEWYAEIRSVTNQSAEMALAVRLNEARQTFWETNLAVVLKTFLSVDPEVSRQGDHRMSFKRRQSPNLFEFEPNGQWLVFGIGQGTNSLMTDMLKRIRGDHSPHEFLGTNSWFEANVDPAAVIRAFPFARKVPDTLARIVLNVGVDGKLVGIDGGLSFTEPLPIKLEPWNLPTNLIGGQLTSITAVRGVQSLIAQFESSFGLNFGPPPNQIYFWSYPGIPAEACFAAPLMDVTNQVKALVRYMTNTLNPLIIANDMGGIVSSQNDTSASWKNLPFLTPSLRIVNVGRTNFLWAGTLPSSPTMGAPSPSVLQFASNQPKLVYFNTEVTGNRIETWLYIAQLMRMAFAKPQLPLDGAGITWLKAISPKLENCATSVTLTDVNKLSFVRKSTLGFSAIELQMIVDWLESSQFPAGWHTFRASP